MTNNNQQTTEKDEQAIRRAGYNHVIATIAEEIWQRAGNPPSDEWKKKPVARK